MEQWRRGSSIASRMVWERSITLLRNWPTVEKMRSLPGLPVTSHGWLRRKTIEGAAEDHGTALGRR